MGKRKIKQNKTDTKPTSMTTTQRTVDVTPHLAQHIVEKDHVGVVLDNGLEKGLVSFVRRNVQGCRVV